MAAEIDRWVPRPNRVKGGRPPYPTELMTRLLVLQQLFNLSDEQMEFQLLDRMSFQRFAGLKNSARVPDRNTIWNFRERLVQAKVEHLIFGEVQRQLQLNSFNAREGQIIDASIVRAPIQHNTAEQQEAVKQRAVPIEWQPAKRRQKDVETRAGTSTRLAFR
jgi:IS5 family transposase